MHRLTVPITRPHACVVMVLVLHVHAAMRMHTCHLAQGGMPCHATFGILVQRLSG